MTISPALLQRLKARAAGALDVQTLAFTFDTPGIEDGVEVFTSTVDDLLIGVTVSVSEAFDGGSPTMEFGPLLNPPDDNLQSDVDLVSVDNEFGITPTYRLAGFHVLGGNQFGCVVFSEAAPMKVRIAGLNDVMTTGAARMWAYLVRMGAV